MLSALVFFVALGGLALYKFLLYPLFISPLAPIPAIHPLAKISPLYALWLRLTHRENLALLAAHQEKGEVVRLGPSELSVNCVDDGIKTIYGRFDKPNFYSVFDEYGTTCLFSSLYHGPHSVKKKRISHIYSKSSLLSSPAMAGLSRELTRGHLLPFCRKYAQSGATFDAVILHKAISMDYVTAYFFGLKNGTRFISDRESQDIWYADFALSRPLDTMVWRHELPRLTRMLNRIGIFPVPKSQRAAWEGVDKRCLAMCDGAERTLADPEHSASRPEDYPTVYQHLKAATTKEGFDASPSVCVNSLDVPKSKSDLAEGWRRRSPQQLEVAAELTDQMVASHDAMSTQLVYIYWQLSRHPDVQSRLRRELRALWGTADGDVDTPVPDARDIDALPYLNAVVTETMRLHPALAGSQPRVTPHGQTCTLGKYNNIPGGVRVQANALSLHHNPDVFPDPDSWLPDRWLPSDKEEDKAKPKGDRKERWFWVFGSGSRMCIGSNLATQVIKHVVSATYANYETYIVEDEGMQQADGLVAPPESDRLILGVRAAD